MIFITPMLMKMKVENYLQNVFRGSKNGPRHEVEGDEGRRKWVNVSPAQCSQGEGRQVC